MSQNKNSNKKLVVMIKEDSNKVVGQHILVANSFFTRFKGLMLKKELRAGEGLLLNKTKQIHTFWMRIPIDVVYLKKLDTTKYEIIALQENMKPWKIGKLYKGANHVLELKTGQIKFHQLQVNDILVGENVLNFQ